MDTLRYDLRHAIRAIGRQPLTTAIVVITLASIFLSTDFSGGFSLSLGALGVISACTLWGLDNNFTRNISAKDPLTIVAWKGLVAGSFSLLLGLGLVHSVKPGPTKYVAGHSLLERRLEYRTTQSNAGSGE